MEVGRNTFFFFDSENQTLVVVVGQVTAVALVTSTIADAYSCGSYV